MAGERALKARGLEPQGLSHIVQKAPDLSFSFVSSISDGPWQEKHEREKQRLEMQATLAEEGSVTHS